MKNKWVRLVVTVLLGALVVNVGNIIGGMVGNIITIFGGVAVIYGIVEVFRTPKNPPTTTS